MSMAERHVAPNSFMVSVGAAKAKTPPSRLQTIRLAVQLPDALNAERDSLVRRPEGA
jgi:hypothetical protein